MSRSSKYIIVKVPAASSEPITATPLGIPGSSISERITTKAPPSCQLNDVRPWKVVPGTSGCVPVVRQSPSSGASGVSAGLSRCASRPIGAVIRRMVTACARSFAPVSLGQPDVPWALEGEGSAARHHTQGPFSLSGEPLHHGGEGVDRPVADGHVGEPVDLPPALQL